MSIGVALPDELAGELLADNACTLPLSRRGAGSELAVAVMVVGAAADLTTVLVAAPSIRRFAAALVRAVWQRREAKAPASVELVLRRSDGSELRASVTGLDDAEAAELVAQVLVRAATA